MRKNITFFLGILAAMIVVMSFRVAAFAEEATSTPPTEEQTVAATTTESIMPQADASTATASSTDSQATTTEVVIPPPAPEESAPAPALSPTAVELPPSPEPPPAPVALTSEPQPIEPVIPFTSSDGHAFDPATAPSKVRLKILNLDGSVPTIPVFITFVGVGGRTYGGPLDREGAIETIMPTGRYYADVLVLDTKFGPPSNPPAFFLEANEERDFGVLTLTDKSSFADEALEREFTATLEGKSGFAKIFSLIVKLLLAILKELRGLRSELLGR